MAFGTKGKSVYAGGTPRAYATATYRVKTTTNLRAGVLVVKDTTDEEIQAAGAGAQSIIGLLTERNLTNPEWDPTTAPAVGDEMEVILIGSGAWGWARNGANLSAGNNAVTSGTGRLAAAAEIGVAAGATSVTSTAANGEILEGSILPGGELIKLLKDSDGSGSETDALVVL